jgi:hypothetical protein
MSTTTCKYNSEYINELYSLDTYNSICIDFNNITAHKLTHLKNQPSHSTTKLCGVKCYAPSDKLPDDTIFEYLLNYKGIDNIIFGVTLSNYIKDQEHNYLIPFVYVDADDVSLNMRLKFRISILDINDNMTEGCYMDIDMESHSKNLYVCYDYLNIENFNNYVGNNQILKMIVSLISLVDTDPDISCLNETYDATSRLSTAVGSEIKAYSQYIEELNNNKTVVKINKTNIETVFQNVSDFLTPKPTISISVKSTTLVDDFDTSSDTDYSDTNDLDEPKKITEIPLPKIEKVDINDIVLNEKILDNYRNISNTIYCANPNKQLEFLSDHIYKTDWDNMSCDLSQLNNKSLKDLQKISGHLKLLTTLMDGLVRDKEIESITKNQNNDKLNCHICQDNLIDTVLIPCGHFVSCHECVDDMIFKKNINSNSYHLNVQPCPICKQPINSTQKVFMSN